MMRPHEDKKAEAQRMKEFLGVLQKGYIAKDEKFFISAPSVASHQIYKKIQEVKEPRKEETVNLFLLFEGELMASFT